MGQAARKARLKAMFGHCNIYSALLTMVSLRAQAVVIVLCSIAYRITRQPSFISSGRSVVVAPN